MKTETMTVIAGAGPAGLMAAISAAKSSAKVAVYERMKSPGLKLLATGEGRCNLTNKLPLMEFAQRFGKEWRFTLPALQALSPDGLRKLFSDLGVPTQSHDGFHVFPVSNRASDILDALLSECSRRSVEIITGTSIASVLAEGGKVSGAVTDRGETLHADKIILSCGGKSYESLGSDGSGYLVARSAGHSIVEPVPALVDLRTEEKWPCECRGISLEDVELRSGSGRSVEKSRGELLFTHFGISGPAVLDISGSVSEKLNAGGRVQITVAFFPGKDLAFWMDEFERWHRSEGRKLVDNLLGRHLPKNLASKLCIEAGCHDLEASRFPMLNRQKLAGILIACPLSIKGSSGFEKAMVTRGGVRLKEVDPSTLESRILQGLHFAGEVLDIDGPCGGFNLQWAFSSGFIAGQRIIKR